MKRSKHTLKSTSHCNQQKGSNGTSLKNLVEAYRKLQKDSDGCCESLHGLLRHYKKMSNLEDVIEMAAYAQNSQGKRHSHQYRISSTALENGKRILKKGIQNENSFDSFEALHDWFSSQCSNKSDSLGLGLGPLYIYDTCLRIGAYLKLMPKFVYLHSGALIGARALLAAVKCKKLRVSDFPKELQILKPYEIEDFLCIYKNELSHLHSDF
jgi:hypothetical protein